MYKWRFKVCRCTSVYAAEPKLPIGFHTAVRDWESGGRVGSGSSFCLVSKTLFHTVTVCNFHLLPRCPHWTVHMYEICKVGTASLLILSRCVHCGRARHLWTCCSITVHTSSRSMCRVRVLLVWSCPDGARASCSGGDVRLGIWEYVAMEKDNYSWYG